MSKDRRQTEEQAHIIYLRRSRRQYQQNLYQLWDKQSIHAEGEAPLHLLNQIQAVKRRLGENAQQLRRKGFDVDDGYVAGDVSIPIINGSAANPHEHDSSKQDNQIYDENHNMNTDAIGEDRNFQKSIITVEEDFQSTLPSLQRTWVKKLRVGPLHFRSGWLILSGVAVFMICLFIIYGSYNLISLQPLPIFLRNSIYIILLYLSISFPLGIYLQRFKFMRLPWLNINIEADNKGNLYLSTIGGRCPRCDGELGLMELDSKESCRTVAACHRYPTAHYWMFDRDELSPLDYRANTKLSGYRSSFLWPFILFILIVGAVTTLSRLSEISTPGTVSIPQVSVLTTQLPKPQPEILPTKSPASLPVVTPVPSAVLLTPADTPIAKIISTTLIPTIVSTAIMIPQISPKGIWLLKNQGIVTSNRLNVRSGPGIDYGSVCELDKDARFIINGRLADERWLFVEPFDGVSGWIFAPHVTTGQAISEYPVAEVAHE